MRFLSQVSVAFCATVVAAKPVPESVSAGATLDSLPGLGLRHVTNPSDDPFYAAPSNLSSYDPGAVIRSRRPPGKIALLRHGIKLADAWQLLYRTTGAQGEALASVTTLLIPNNADYGKLLSYQVEIDAPFSGCFPSVTLQADGQNIDNAASQYSELWMVSVLDKGWLVSVPDHDGPSAAFTAGVLTGYATLDGIRAVLSSGWTGIRPDARVAAWGFSGGAQPTEFALELRSSYAPEITITAAAMGGLPVDLRNSITKLNKGWAAGLAVNGLIGLSRAYPGVERILSEQLRPDKKDFFKIAETQCTVSSLADYAFLDVFDFFKDGASALDLPVAVAAISENRMGHRGV